MRNPTRLVPRLNSRVLRTRGVAGLQAVPHRARRRRPGPLGGHRRAQTGPDTHGSERVASPTRSRPPRRSVSRFVCLCPQRPLGDKVVVRGRGGFEDLPAGAFSLAGQDGPKPGGRPNANGPAKHLLKRVSVLMWTPYGPTYPIGGLLSTQFSTQPSPLAPCCHELSTRRGGIHVKHAEPSRRSAAAPAVRGRRDCPRGA